MADKDVITAMELCASISQDGCMMLCPYKDDQDETYPGLCEHIMKQDALELLKRQQAEIDRLKAEKNRVIEQIENEINILHKESRNVKDEVGTATYEWLINGFQASLDMIKDGEHE